MHHFWATTGNVWGNGAALYEIGGGDLGGYVEPPDDVPPPQPPPD